MGLWQKILASMNRPHVGSLDPATALLPTLPDRDTVMSQAASPAADASANPRIDTLAQVYAQSLLELAEDAGQLDSMAEQVDQLAALLANQPELKPLFSSPAISASARQDLLKRLFEGRVSDLLFRFLQVVARKNRLGSLPGIFAAFQKLLAEKRGIIEVDAFVAARLSDEQATEVAQSIRQQLGVSDVILRQHEDPALIGGLKLQIGDHLIDGSVATQLKNLTRRTVARGREHARTATRTAALPA